MKGLEEAKRMLNALTPLKTDCGAYCGAACCGTDEDGQGGVYLFPGEEKAMSTISWGTLEEDGFGTMLVCHDACDREKRPLGCRIFPLTPVEKEDGTWSVRMDARARAMCPLVRSGIKGLDREFAQTVRDAIRLLAEEEEGRDFLRKWQALEQQFRFEL